MRKPRNIIAIISMTIFLSCQTNKVENVDISGKWWTYNISETEYCEFDIDKNTIGEFCLYGGNSPSSEYKIDKDTLHFLDQKFILKVISKSQFTLTSQNRTDTLTRLSNTIQTFREIENRSDSIFNLFYTEFTDRAHNCWTRYGYVNERELENSLIKDGVIEEELIQENKK
jgi:hypothetical protein